MGAAILNSISYFAVQTKQMDTPKKCNKNTAEKCSIVRLEMATLIHPIIIQWKRSEDEAAMSYFSKFYFFFFFFLEVILI